MALALEIFNTEQSSPGEGGWEQADLARRCALTAIYKQRAHSMGDRVSSLQ